MRPRPARKTAALAVSCLVVAGLLVSVLALSTAGAAEATSAQLATMIQTAQSSRSYASEIVDLAASYGLNVTSGQHHLVSGDSLLAQARADLSSSSNLEAGMGDARAAMDEYTAAAAGSSLALHDAHLTASVDLSAAIDAETEVNATLTLVGRVAGQACASISVSAPNASLFQDSCARAHADVANATVELNQAASIISQLHGNMTASLGIAQALTILAQARERVNAAATEIATISSFTYHQRGETYYSQVLLGLYSSANATIGAQASTLTSLEGIRSSFGVNSRAQSLAVANVSALISAATSVDTSSVSKAASASEATAADVSSNLTSLLTIATPLIGSASLISAINSAQTSTTTYSSACSAAETKSSGYSSASLSSFPGYLSELDADKSSVQSTGASYISSYASVQVQLSALINTLGVLAPPALRSANSTLAALKASVSSTSSSLNQALSAETASMSTLEGRIQATNGAIAEPDVIVAHSTIQAAIEVASNERPYLNQSSLAVVDSASTSIQSEANESKSYVEAANSSMAGTVGGLESSAASLESSGSSLDSSATATGSALSNAHAEVAADLALRTNEAVSAKVLVASALSMFSALDVADGVSAMLSAGVDFEAAASTH